ncbi:MAG: GNAT family N-acetyltransferase [Pseudomonadota bacterium]
MAWTSGRTDLDLRLLTGIRAGDLPALRDHMRRAHVETYGALIPPTGLSQMLHPLGSADLGGLATDGGFISLWEDEAPVGVAAWEAADALLRINHISVRKARQRRGTGRRLLSATLRSAPAEARVEVTVLRAAAGAHAFFLACGFVEDDATVHALAPGHVLPATILSGPVSGIRTRLADLSAGR